MTVSTHPAVGEDVSEGDPLLLLHSQAGADEVPAGRRHVLAELHHAGADLLVPLEGNVAADHVVEEDPEGPDSGAACLVVVEFDPLWRSVHSGPCNRGVTTRLLVSRASPSKSV